MRVVTPALFQDLAVLQARYHGIEAERRACLSDIRALVGRDGVAGVIDPEAYDADRPIEIAARMLADADAGRRNRAAAEAAIAAARDQSWRT